MPQRPPVHQPISWRPRSAQRLPSNPFYRTPIWQTLRLATLKRDGFQCRLTLPGCGVKANTAHHRIPREMGGADALWNLLSSCPSCHNKAHREKGGAH
jgi:5-methylcytosine-specific restriction endonuclease McrA